MIKKSSQQGSVHVIVTVILALALVTALGVIFWQNFIDKDEVATQNTSDTSETATVKSSSDTTADASDLPEAVDINNEGYVVVKEWGVRFKSSVSDKLEYKISSHTGLSANLPYEVLGLTIKSDALQDKGCTTIGIDLYRQTQKESDFNTLKIGDHYYFVTGGPGQCSQYESDMNIQTTIINELKIDNLEAI